MKLVTLKTTILAAFCLLTASQQVFAQFAITTGTGAPGVVTALAGSGLTISNVTINCATAGYGTFTGGTASGMGITNGVVMSTGNAGNIDNAGTNFNDDLSTSNGTPTSTDAQLVSVVGSSPVRDPCFIEFDVIPRCGTISIVFVFGSDEYTNWVSSSFNDGFGFFVTGPNPAGGNYTNMNIARLPNSTIVSIDNVNQTVNPTFFVNNNAGTFGNHFDGFTTVLSPSFNVTPCQSYHFKLAIGDASDAIVDSGVLIDVIQCTSPLVATAASTPATCTTLGTATATVSSGTGPFTYSWSPSGGTGATATNLAPGTYTVTIDDAISCQPPITVSVTVGTNYTPPVATVPANVTVCHGNTVAAGNFVSVPVGATWTWTNSNPAIGLVASGTGNTPSFTATNTTGSPITGTITITPTIGTCVGTPVSYTVTVNPTLVPTFNPLTAVCQNGTAPALPASSTNGVTGNWTPATLSTTSSGSACATFTPTGGTCPTSATLCLTINAPTTPTFSPPSSVCQGSVAPTPPASSTEGITGGWTPATYSTSSSGTSTITFTPTPGLCATTASSSITVTAPVTPSFTPPTSVCQGATPPTPPNPSNDGYTGTWAAASFSTASSGTSTLTFTPTAGQCATTTTLSLVVNPLVPPTFPAPAAVCQGDAAPALPNPSNEGFNGTWNPTTFSTASSGSSTCTFTPSAGVCATTATLTLTINTPVTPTFPAPAAVCQGDAAPALPNPSNEGFTGTWNPTSFSTASAGSSVCTFTPSAGVCATTALLTLTINAPVTPTFPAPAAVCEGDAAPALPNPSNEGFAGTWNPTSFSTGSAGSSVCTFTPSAGICATTALLTLTINAPVTPTFPAPAAVCQGDPAPALPNPSNEGFNGTWNPTSFSTASAGSSVCTFTPSAGICATTALLTLTINAPTVPTFNPIPPMCVGDPAPALPVSSNEGNPGTWTPATISTAAAGSFTFTFHPTAGTCVTTATITVTVGPPATPTFAPVGPFCAGDAIAPLPVISIEGITGTWAPAAINNAATTTYTFNPTAGLCATTATLTIVINPPVTPTFAPVGPYCVGETIPDLPTTSINGYTGTWLPSAIDNTATTAYTFTPDPGQCATTATLTIVINPSIMPTFTPPAPFCEGGVAPVLPGTSDNSITGTWDPTPVSNTASGTYTFTPDAGQCASSMTLSVTVNPNPTITVPPVTTCANTDVVMTASGGVSYSWAPSMGLSATTGTSVTANVPAPGPYTYTITGTDANGCVGTATTMVNIAAGLTINVNPPSANLCEGGSVVLTASGATTYNWSPATDLSATTGATVTASPTVTTTYTVDGNSSGCVGQTTVVITVGTQVTPTFDPITALCSGSPAPILQNPSNEGINGTWAPAVVSNTASGTYTFTPAAGECAITATLSVTVNPVPTVTSIDETCNGTNTSYVVTVTISGGTPPFTLTENAPGGIGGSFSGNVWTSNPIPSATAYDFDFMDATGCGPANASGSKNCNCATNVGTMDVTPLSLCEGQTASPTYNSAGEVLDADDVQSFVLHTGSGGTLGTIIQSNTSGTFSFAPPMVYGTTYRITALAGNNDGSGLVDINDPCLDVATGTPVVWYQTPVATPSSNTPLCEGQTLNLTGNAVTGGTYQWTGPAAFSNTQQSPSILNVTTANAGTYMLVITANGCPSLPATTDVVINAPTLPTFNPIAAVCQGAAAPVLVSPSTNAIPGTWAPSFVNTASAGTQTFTFTPNAGQCATSTTISVTINALPVPSATSASTCPNTSVGICASGGTSYVWSPGATLDNPNIACPTATVAATQTYNVLVTDANGCSATTTSTVTMAPGLTISVNPSSATICAGQSTGLTASGATSYTWSPGAGLSSTSTASVTASPAGTQVYTVTGNSNGCIGTTTVTVTVNPVPVMNAIADIAQCEGTTVGTVTFGTTPAGSSFAWTNTNAAIGVAASGTSSSISSFTGSTGTGTITVTPSLSGCTGTPETFDIVINSNPIPTAGSNSPVCEGATLNITSNAPAGSSYSWSGPQSFGNTNQNPSISPVAVNQAGNYTVTVIDANGCSGSATTAVVVNPLPVPTVAQIGPFCIDDNNTYLLTGSPTAPPGTGSFSGAGVSGNNFMPSNVGAAGPATVTYSYTDVNGCSGTGTSVITINPLPTVVINSDVQSGCSPLVVTFDGGSGMASSEWSFGDGSSGTDPGTGSITHTYTSPGTYDVTLVNTTMAGCTATVTVADYITVHPDPVADFSVREIELSVIDPTVHAINSSTGASTYSWDFGDGQGSSTAVDPSYTYDATPSTYTIELTATSAFGCTDVAELTIIVKDQLVFWVPNTFTPDGDAYNNTFQPVFSSGYDPYNFSLFIFNRWGEIVFESHNVEIGWDGTYRGQIVQEGTYTWTMEIKDPQTDEVSRHEGHVNIMR